LLPKQFKQVWGKIIKLLKDKESSNIIQMKGYPYSRTDIGEYRIVFFAEKDILKIAVVEKRNDDEINKAVSRK
jgi:mRNA interferase RelE/StbE